MPYKTNKRRLSDGIMIEIVLQGDNLHEEAENLLRKLEKDLGHKYFRGFYKEVKIIN